MDYKIVNGTIVTATETYRADVGIDKGKITQIAKKIKEQVGGYVKAEEWQKLKKGETEQQRALTEY